MTGTKRSRGIGFTSDFRRLRTGSSGVLVLHGTAEEVVRLLPDKSVDSVFLLDVIEHLAKEDGHRLLGDCERVAREQIVLFTPLGFLLQEYAAGEVDAWGYHGGQWQSHRSGWSPEDFGEDWDILASSEYHEVSAKDGPLPSPAGAFWAVRNLARAASSLRVAVLARSLPPWPSEDASALLRLLRPLPAENYCLLSRGDYSPHKLLERLSPPVAAGARLPARYHQLPPERALRRPNRASLLPARLLADRALFVAQRARAVLQVVEREDCTAIAACTGDLVDIPAGSVASRRARIPFYPVFFSDYRQWKLPVDRHFARVAEPVAVRGAAKVIVATESLRSLYRKRYGVDAATLDHDAPDTAALFRAAAPGRTY